MKVPTFIDGADSSTVVVDVFVVGVTDEQTEQVDSQLVSLLQSEQVAGHTEATVTPDS